MVDQQAGKRSGRLVGIRQWDQGEVVEIVKVTELCSGVNPFAMAREAINIALATTKQPIMLARVKRQALSSARFAALRSICGTQFVFYSGKDLVTDNTLLV